MFLKKDVDLILINMWALHNLSLLYELLIMDKLINNWNSLGLFIFNGYSNDKRMVI